MSERVEGSGPDSNDDPADFRVHVATQAIRLFAEHGYEATTVDQIAAAAGVSRRTFFRQFRDELHTLILSVGGISSSTTR